MFANKYSQKNILIFAVVAILVAVLFALFSQNAGLFKGQLTLNTPADFDSQVTLELANCDDSVCTNPLLITSNQQPVDSLEILVKSAFTGEVVYADYLTEMEADSRYEVAFNSSLCGTYSFDAITTRYNIESTTTCETGTYDFLVSGAVRGLEGLPIFTEFVSFILTE